ncbi:MAG TPA: Uma2 family endonuclease [Gemmataceae bacterium]|nr:Uma2 family endonuclease [Gemmataceae bacterium]
MIEVPSQIEGFEVLEYGFFKEAILPSRYKPPADGSPHMEPSQNIAICRRPGDDTYHVLFCTASWKRVTSDFCYTLEAARELPATEFGESVEQWQEILHRCTALHHGDQLTVAEFHRRYLAMEGVKKAELIDGMVYIPTADAIEWHGSPHADLAGWLGVYRTFTPGVQAGDNATLLLPGSKSEPQPDLLLRILPQHGGRTSTVDGYVAGAPEHVDEIAESSASYDLHSKLKVYHQAGVLEYVVWRVWDRAIDWFVRDERDYQKIASEAGIYRSRVFPGLWLDANAMIAGDMQRVLAVLQQGIAKPEHAAFCEKLRQK